VADRPHREERKMTCIECGKQVMPGHDELCEGCAAGVSRALELTAVDYVAADVADGLHRVAGDVAVFPNGPDDFGLRPVAAVLAADAPEFASPGAVLLDISYALDSLLSATRAVVHDRGLDDVEGDAGVLVAVEAVLVGLGRARSGLRVLASAIAAQGEES
jgi:hypothetical protein